MKKWFFLWTLAVVDGALLKHWNLPRQQQQQLLTKLSSQENDFPKNSIQVQSQIELPFSAEEAYDVYTDLPKQALWSDWLESVQILNDDNSDQVESLWTSKLFGIKYSWKAVSVENQRPHTIRWRSISGLRNEGVVRFYKKTSYRKGPTLMTLQMTFVAPRAVSAITGRSKRLTNYVEEKMIANSLEQFKNLVSDSLEEERRKGKAAKNRHKR